ncbi:MAG TPA: SPFH domain-containing protein, partial [Opitutaceae bacterium]
MATPVPSGQGQNHERAISAPSGWLMLFVVLALFAAAFAVFFLGGRGTNLLWVGCLIAGIFISCGFFTLQPNEAAVLILFG